MRVCCHSVPADSYARAYHLSWLPPAPLSTKTTGQSLILLVAGVGSAWRSRVLPRAPPSRGDEDRELWVY